MLVNHVSFLMIVTIFTSCLNISKPFFLHGFFMRFYYGHGHWHSHYLPQDPTDLVCVDQNEAIIQLYQNMSEITPELFHLSSNESFANSHANPGDVGNRQSSCKKRIPEAFKGKFDEVANILKNLTCSTNSSHNQNTHQRKRRQVTSSLTPGKTIRNSDGSITNIRHCLERGSLSSDNTYRLCRECVATTTLPITRFPRYLNEWLCDSNENTCLLGEGACRQNSMTLTFLQDTNSLGTNKLYDWTRYPQNIRTSCSCNVLKSSKVLKGFI